MSAWWLLLIPAIPAGFYILVRTGAYAWFKKKRDFHL